MVRSFMEYGATVWDPYQKYNSDKVERVQRRAAGLSKVGIHHTLVFLICLMSWGGRLFLKGDRRLDLFCFTKLLTVWHKCHSKASLLRINYHGQSCRKQRTNPEEAEMIRI